MERSKSDIIKDLISKRHRIYFDRRVYQDFLGRYGYFLKDGSFKACSFSSVYAYALKHWYEISWY